MSHTTCLAASISSRASPVDTHIRDLKGAKRAMRERGEVFSPGLSAQGGAITSQQEPDALVHDAEQRRQAARAAGR